MAVLNFLSGDSHQNYLKAFLFLGLAFISIWLFPLLHRLFISSTRKIPGSFWARVTQWYEFRLLLRGDSNLEYIRLHQKYGPVVRMGPNRYSFSEPEDVKIIYELGGKFIKTEFYEPLNHPEPDKRNIFAMRDPNAHKERRRRIANLYSMSTMVSYEDAVNNMTDICVRKFRQFVDEKRQISLPNFMQYYAFDVIGEITFNKSFEMMEHEGDTINMVEGIHEANGYLAHAGLVPDLHPWFTRLQKLMGKEPGANVMVRYSLSQIEKHREANAKGIKEKKYDSFLKKVLDLEAQGKVRMPHIMDACGSNVGAGSDTTGITLSAAIYHLYNNPEKLAKLRQELDTMAADGRISDPVTFQQAQSMPYLQGVIKETLRMHPAVGTILARKVPKGGVKLAGTYFPEGTDVGANAWVLHYSKNIFGPDADVYRPERWLEAKRDGDVRDAMMFAFGAGSRTCIGKNISLLEVNKALPQIVRNFDFIFEDDGLMHSYCAWFVYPKFNVQVKMRGTE